MFVHAADAHLGIARYSRSDPQTGINLRSLDFLYSFNNLCDRVLQLEPEVFLLCGDVFDRVNPTNYMRRAVQERFMELSAASIDTVVISGNHETPRSKGVSNPLVLYKNIEHVHIILEPKELSIGGYWINAVPFTAHPQNYLSRPNSDDYSILMLHTTIEGARVGSERYMCFEEGSLKRSTIPEYDYAALGHIHKAQELSTADTKIIYPGSLERYDFNEIDEKKGFYVVDNEPRFIELPTRPMISVPVEVEGLTGYEITERSIDIIEGLETLGSILRLEILGKMDEVERNTINYAKINESALGAMHFSIVDRSISNDQHRIREEMLIFSPYAELERYLRMVDAYTDELYELGCRMIEGRIIG
jgi:DNA repair exonuclease SbcCD nuclease subunit